jgi:protein-S-isoprenylcysteine O-methyltransferase Ste14
MGEGEAALTAGRKRLWTTALFSFAYLAAALACLVQWNSLNLWSRVDIFAGTYLGLRAAGSIHSILSSRRAFRSRPVLREWWSVSSNPYLIRWVVLLMISELLVYLDYGHWHATAFLERRAFQVLGLGFYVFSAAWQMWTDACLAKYFAKQTIGDLPISNGPFRYIRHPRYAGALASKLALALVFASAVGWLLALAWTVLLLKQIRAEEAHLSQIFGAQYEVYAHRTARLLPGVY